MSFVNDKKETLQSIVSQLAAVDGYAVHAICKSKFIRESLCAICAKGFRFPLGESNIVDLIVSDGASVMKKLVRISHVDHQVCYAHGLHLAVCDILYKSRSVANVTIEDDDNVDDHDEEMVDESLSKATPTTEEIPVFNPEIEDVIGKVRKVVKVLRKSAVKNEVLQKYVVVEHKKELSLVLDCTTRWSSV